MCLRRDQITKLQQRDRNFSFDLWKVDYGMDKKERDRLEIGAPR